jgi:Tat protein translocase TatC
MSARLPPPSPSDDAEMPLIAHLTELRQRLIRALFAVLLTFASLVYFAKDIYHFVSEPLRRFLPEGSTMIATEVASPFLAPFKLTLIVAALLAMPYVLYQAWAFIAPGMYRHEKRFALPLLVSSIVLFYSGVAFAYYLVCPMVFGFFTHISPEGRIGDDGHQPLPRFRADLVLRFRLCVRGTRGYRVAGLGRHHDAAGVDGQAALRDRRLLRRRHAAHTARRVFANDARGADVGTVRDRHRRESPAARGEGTYGR